jgi:phage terminase large subunit
LCNSICQIFYYNGGYIVNEIAYTKGLSNKKIADIIFAYPSAPVIADSAEPKSIDELRLYGLTVISATKGKGSVSQGIQFVQAQRISITKSSVNGIKDFRNYLWKKDINGKILSEPEHDFSHFPAHPCRRKDIVQLHVDLHNLVD